MEIEYDGNKLKKKLSNALEIKKSYGDMAKKVSSRMDEIVASPNLTVLKQIPSANCHPLKGDKDGYWAVSISGNHRLIFEIAHDPVPVNDDDSINTDLVTKIKIMGTMDYH